MSELKFCPKCLTSRECTKKGFNKKGEQFWYCKTCHTKFIASQATSDDVQRVRIMAKTKKTGTTNKETNVIVNNNIIKTVSEFITVDQAFDLAKGYFKEIAKEQVEVDETPTKKTIRFKITAGTKG